MPCEHAFARYPVDPRNGVRIPPGKIGDYGAYAYNLRSFCMHCGTAKEPDMRPVTLNPDNVRASFNEIDRASHENDIVEIAQNFTVDAAFTKTLQLLTSAPDLNNVVAVLATLLEIMQKGGLNRTT